MPFDFGVNRPRLNYPGTNQLPQQPFQADPRFQLNSGQLPGTQPGPGMASVSPSPEVVQQILSQAQNRNQSTNPIRQPMNTNFNRPNANPNFNRPAPTLNYSPQNRGGY